MTLEIEASSPMTPHCLPTPTPPHHAHIQSLFLSNKRAGQHFLQDPATLWLGVMVVCALLEVRVPWERVRSGPEVLARRPSPVPTNESTGTARSWGLGVSLGTHSLLLLLLLMWFVV